MRCLNGRDITNERVHGGLHRLFFFSPWKRPSANYPHGSGVISSHEIIKLESCLRYGAAPRLGGHSNVPLPFWRIGRQQETTLKTCTEWSYTVDSNKGTNYLRLTWWGETANDIRTLDRKAPIYTRLTNTMQRMLHINSRHHTVS
ncbi:hypothetical protein AFLA_002278 [Aspergillus flavus NRRL3357]|nr:hypothetical protein AFLA_002278 [Aspergillus flavus NRRL3357]